MLFSVSDEPVTVSTDQSAIMEDLCTLLLEAQVRTWITAHSIRKIGQRPQCKEFLDMGDSPWPMQVQCIGSLSRLGPRTIQTQEAFVMICGSSGIGSDELIRSCGETRRSQFPFHKETHSVHIREDGGYRNTSNHNHI